MKKSICFLLFIVVLVFQNFLVFAQSQDENEYHWLETSSDGNWLGGNERWQAPGGGNSAGPAANRKLRFNNNHQTSMQNNRSSGFQIYQLIFGSGSSSSRTINGNSVIFNPDYNLNNSVKVENYSSATHTINLAISRGSGTGDLQLNPVYGNLIFSSTIDNGGKWISIWGNNSKSIEFNNIIQGNGGFAIRQYSLVKFNATNTYTGSTVIDQGELWIMANGGISSSSSIWLGNNCCPTLTTKLFLADGDGGQTFSNPVNFNYGDAGKQILGGLNSSGTNTFSSNNISIPSGKTLTIEEVPSGGTLEFSNGISGEGAINIIGGGTTLFTGANSYTGLTTVTSGLLRLNRAGGTTIPTTNSITVSGGTLRVSSSQGLNSLTISSGSNLIVDAGVTLTINGTFTGGGTIQNDGSIIITGSSSFPGSNTTISSMNHLTINRSAGVILDKSMIISGILSLTNGVLVLGSSDLTISGTISGAGNTRFISTTGTGRLKRNISNNNSFVFPVGNSTYNPIILTNKTGVDDDFSVRVVDEVYADGSSSGSLVSITNRVKRTWDIAKTLANGGAGVDLLFNWTPASHVNGTVTIPKVYHFESSAWVKKSTTVNTVYDLNSGTLTFTGYAGSFSPFAIMDDGSALPVTWQSFTAKKQPTTVELNWSTASEQNTKDFEVQYSTNTQDWLVLGTVAAAGNSSTTKEYIFTHNSPLKGSIYNYYRIKQNDVDGKFSYSKIVSIVYNEPGIEVQVYPNPVKDIITIYLAESQQIRLVNMVGATVWHGSMAAGRNQLLISHLPKGVYALMTLKGPKQILIQ